MSTNLENLDFNYLMKNQRQLKTDSFNKKEQVMEYDFKIVSFKIGQEFYGIDIMHVKEIKKVNEKQFTLVPNTLKFVVGVLNLRGEIIPIIDLAKMFNLVQKNSDMNIFEHGKKDNKVKSIIVIKVEDLLIGLIVEQIQRVVPLRKKDIQPPSPLLGSINEKYINGVAEIDDKLYVIFDTDEIFSSKSKVKKDVLPQVSDLSEEFFVHFCNQIEEFSSIHISDINKHFIRELYAQYIEANNITEMPTITKDVSSSIILQFESKHTNELWRQPYVDQFKEAVVAQLKKICSEEVRVIVIGCGHGHEAFSIYFILKEYFKDADIKMIAADVNLSAVSNASGFEIEGSKIPAWIKKNDYFMKLSDDTYKIKQEINKKIYFEFHDARNFATYNKQFDIVIARDMSMYLSMEQYKHFLNNVCSKLVSGGVFVMGDNEELFKHPDVTKIMNQNITIYQKK